jgi:uncharacterized protein YjbI with pentapeptide repeats
MSDYRPEASGRSAVKTELTSAHLTWSRLLISLASGLFVPASGCKLSARTRTGQLRELSWLPIVCIWGRTDAQSPKVLHVLRRWASWSRSGRWLAGGIAAVVLAMAIAWLLFVPVADWFAHHDVGSAKGSLHEVALDNARGRLLTLAAGLLAGGALVFTALNFNLLRRTSERTDLWQRRTHELTEQGQVTDRYTKAIEQLGSDKLDVRIGGIYALERVARDSARDHSTVMEVLTAFIREHSCEQWPPPDSDGQERKPSIRPDVQAAVTVVARRDAQRDTQTVDLAGARLAGANLKGANLAGANLVSVDFSHASLATVNLNQAELFDADFTYADLHKADLSHALSLRANFSGADLSGSDLTITMLLDARLESAHLVRAKLHRAYLDGADLNGADLNGADLIHAQITRARLVGADLTGANLTNAMLYSSDLTGANLHNANLTGAMLGSELSAADLRAADIHAADLTAADLAGATWPANAPVPEGWKLDDDSGRLDVADSHAEPADAN